MILPQLPGYTLQKRLGQGAFGAVSEALWNGNFPCAVKLLERGTVNPEYLGSVLQRLQDLPLHEGLLPVYAFDLEDAAPHISMALLPGGAVTFENLAGQLTSAEAWRLLHQAATALSWLHGNGIVHGGLTAGNVLVMANEDGSARALITDQGQAWLGQGTMEHLHNQAPYFPPDRWREPGRLMRGVPPATWDVYAFGVTAWRLLNGSWPRANRLFERVYASKTEPLMVDPPAFADWLSEEPAPVWPGVERDPAHLQARALVLRCLSLDPRQRPESMVEVAREWQSVFPSQGSARFPLRKSAPVTAAAFAGVGVHANLSSARPYTAPTAPAAHGSGGFHGDYPQTSRHPSPPGPVPMSSRPSPYSPPSASTPPTPHESPAPGGIFRESESFAENMQVRAESHPLVRARSTDSENTAPIRPLAPMGPMEPPPDPLSAPSPAGQEALSTSVPVPRAVSSGPVEMETPANPPASRASVSSSRSPAQAAGGDSPDTSPAPKRSALRGVVATLAAAACISVGGAGLWFAADQQGKAARQSEEMDALREALTEARETALVAEGRMEAAQESDTAARLAALAGKRDEWTGVVAGILADRPTEESAQAAWKTVAAPFAEQLEAALSAAAAEPELANGNMKSRWVLADLLTHTEQTEKALPLLEQLSRDLEMAAADGAPPDDDRQLLSARTDARRGAILLANRRTMEAAPLLQSASAAYEVWLTGHPDQQDVAREYAKNSLLEGRALLDRQQPEAARTAFTRISGLLGQPESEDFLPADHFTLTDSLFELAAMETSEGKLDPAIELHMQAVRLLVAYDQENRQSTPARRRLADGYLGLGRLLTRKGSPRDASVAFSEAVKLLTELSKESPAEPGYRLQLALTYNEVAQLIRTSRADAAGAREALEYQNGSVTILQNLLETNPLDNPTRQHLAGALVLNGELLETSGDAAAALNRQKEAIALLDDLINESSLSPQDRPVCQRLASRAWASLGSIHDKAGRKKEAIASLSKALETAEGLEPGEPAEERLLANTRERLRKLKPES